ncbi:peptidyl-lysine N-acetyltransferase PatZ-like [Condylostylus longicornis]|uniref:peptidyl-lysine N-acetyltransferase PatZ-like n=1 Tax=Condylostylus longicornis TaxID=2530218 RepID=UPI00244DE956|nr:peptidyl-lysine N-acetyltransferase PatZ-like [Condylostylus longicornis]
MAGTRLLSRSARRLQKQRCALPSLLANTQTPWLIRTTLSPVISNGRGFSTTTSAQLSKCLKPEAAGATSEIDPLQAYFPSRLVTSGLGAIFEPRSIAIIGATERAGSVGRTLVNNLIIGNKAGGNRYEIYPVNPTRQTVLGLPCFSNLENIPGDVDMVVIVTPAQTCVDVMRQAAAKGVKAAVVISAGFKEVGPEGIALENELIRVARDAGIRVIGPNCVGVMNPNIGLNATFAATMGLPGNVAFISQSGAMCTAVLDWSLREKIGFSAFISVGSMADVNWGDLIDYLSDDPNTQSILIYMETIGNAASFLSAAREASLTKPIVVIKAGKSEQAAQAAASHTGSLAGSYASFEAAMHRVGVLTVDTIQELFNCALVLGKQPRPRGPRLMLVTNAGGPGVLATDAAVGAGAQIPDIEARTRERLNAFLPAAWSHHNPVDILGDAPAELYAKSLEVCLEDNNADGVLVILSPQDVTDPTGTARELIKAVEAIKLKNPHPKPILAAWMGGETVAEGFRLLNEGGIPTFANPDDAAATFGKIWKQTEALDALYGEPENRATEDIALITPENRAKCISILKKASSEGRSLLTEAESKQVLDSYGIPIVKTIIAKTPDDADAAAKELGAQLYAVKLNSETLTHKADVGGVKLNLKPDQVKQAFEEIRASVASLHGAQHFQGVTVQPMMRLDKGLELILGSTADAQFGPLVMFGAGGTMVEIFKDTALAIPPLNDNLAENLMKRTKIYKALKGAQGKRFEGVNLSKLQSVLSKFSAMVVDLAEHVAECDINPLLAMRDEFVALDARIALNRSEAPALAVRPYPLNYVSTASLKNGTRLTVRPIHAADEDRLIRFHEGLSPETVRLRYVGDCSLSRRTSKEQMIKTCHADYDRLLTLVAVNDSHEIVGLAQLERPPPNHLHRETAAVRMIVADAFQKLGLGRTFMNQVIEIAKKENLHQLNAAVSVDNASFISLASKTGWETPTQPDSQNVVVCSLHL